MHKEMKLSPVQLGVSRRTQNEGGMMKTGIDILKDCY